MRKVLLAASGIAAVAMFSLVSTAETASAVTPVDVTASHPATLYNDSFLGFGTTPAQSQQNAYGEMQYDENHFGAQCTVTGLNTITVNDGAGLVSYESILTATCPFNVIIS